MSERGYLSIGEVLTLLQAEFPDVTISKIRFLESQGLIDPERTPSGYRKFYEPDVERLRWILRQQKEHFWPLRVIRGKLDAAAGSDGLPTDRPAGAAEARPSPGMTPPEPSPAAPQESSSVASPAAGRAPPAAQPSPAGPRPSSSTRERPPRAPDGAPAPAPAVGRRVAAPFPASLATAARAETARRSEADADAEVEADHRTPAEAGIHAGPRAGRADMPETPPVPPMPPMPPTPPSTGPDLGGRAGPAKPAAQGTETTEAVDPRPATEPAPSESGHPADAEATLRVQAEERRADVEAGRRAEVDAGRRAQADQGRRAAVEAGRKAQAEVGRRAETPVASRGQASGSRPAPPLVDKGGTRRSPASYLTAPVEPQPAAPEEPVELTAEELAEAVGLTLAELADLEKYGLVASRRSSGGQYFDEVALVVAQLAARFARFGVEPRHLRIWRTAAEREAGFFEQVVTPLLKQRNPQARRQAAENLRELATLGNRLHAALVRAELKGRDR